MKTNLFSLTKKVIVLGLAVALAACGTNTTAAPATNSSQSVVVATTASTSAGTNATSASTTASSVTKLNLNTASAAEFAAVPNAGQRMAREFAEYRPYTTILQFRKEIGKYVDAQTVAAYEQYVYVPVDINQADADTLQQLPGVDATIAANLIAARPYANADAFLTKLGSYLTADQVSQAKSYLAS